MWILLVGNRIIDSAAMIISLSQHTWQLNKLCSEYKAQTFAADVLRMEVQLNGQTLSLNE